MTGPARPPLPARYLPLMRLAFALACLPLPAAAWEFSATPVCTLTETTGDAEVTVTYDPSLPEYAITVTLTEGTWDAAPVFAIVFDGPRGLTISTDRHILSGDGRSLTVRDRGFGNVLNGLEFNLTATALSGATAVTLPLTDAAPAVRAFRDCPATITS